MSPPSVLLVILALVKASREAELKRNTVEGTRELKMLGSGNYTSSMLLNLTYYSNNLNVFEVSCSVKTNMGDSKLVRTTILSNTTTLLYRSVLLFTNHALALS